MKTFIYYNQSDVTKEVIGKIKVYNLEQAIEVLSNTKKLHQDQFLNLFNIEEDGKKK
jgi:hypothetical protein